MEINSKENAVYFNEFSSILQTHQAMNRFSNNEFIQLKPLLHISNKEWMIDEQKKIVQQYTTNSIKWVIYLLI